MLHLEPVAAGQHRLWFEASSGQSFILETSQELRVWSAIHTNASVEGRFNYLDETTDQWRFYRARPAQ